MIELQPLVINVKSNAGEKAKGVSSLASALDKLGKATNKGAVGSINTAISTLVETAGRISDSTIGRLNELAESLQRFSGLNFSGLQGFAREVARLEMSTNRVMQNIGGIQRATSRGVTNSPSAQQQTASALNRAIIRNRALSNIVPANTDPMYLQKAINDVTGVSRVGNNQINADNTMFEPRIIKIVTKPDYSNLRQIVDDVTGVNRDTTDSVTQYNSILKSRAVYADNRLGRDVMRLANLPSQRQTDYAMYKWQRIARWQEFMSQNASVNVNSNNDNGVMKGLADLINGRLGVGQNWKGSAEASAQVFMQAFGDIAQPTQQATQAIQQESDAATQASSATASFGDKLRDMASKAAVTAKQGLQSVVSSLKQMGKQAKSAISKSGLFGFLKRFGRIAMYRAIRSAITAITKGLKTGVDNLYQWSKAMKGSFAQSMDTGASSLLTMQNALGTAIAPVLQALIPVFQTVVGWIRTACNALSQFFALLNGSSSWTKATDATTEYAKAAGGAGSATKDLLADWDQLNVIQSQGGGGGGSSATDYSNMFENVTEFDKGIKATVNWLKDNMDTVLSTVGLIGTAIAAWKLGSAFSGDLGKILSLVGAGAVVYFGIKLVRQSTQSYLETGDETTGIISGLSGVATSALAGLIIGKAFGGKEGIITAGLVATISGSVMIETAFQFSAQEGETSETIQTKIIGALQTIGGATLAGARMAGLKGALIGAAAGVVITITSAVIGYKKGIKEKALETIQSLETDVTVQMSVVQASIANVEQARSELTKALRTLNSRRAKITLSVDTTQTQIDSLNESAQTVIDAINKYCAENIVFLQAVIELNNASTGVKLSNNETITDAIVEWSTINTTMQEYGKQLMEALADGIQDGEAEVIDQLIQSLNNIQSAVATAQSKASANSAIAFAVANGDDIVDAYNEQYNKAFEQAKKVARSNYETYTSLYEYFNGIGDIEKANKYKQAADEVYAQYVDGSFAKSYAESVMSGVMPFVSEVVASALEGAEIPKNWQSNPYYSPKSTGEYFIDNIDKFLKAYGVPGWVNNLNGNKTGLFNFIPKQWKDAVYSSWIANAENTGDSENVRIAEEQFKQIYGYRKTWNKTGTKLSKYRVPSGEEYDGSNLVIAGKSDIESLKTTFTNQITIAGNAIVNAIKNKDTTVTVNASTSLGAVTLRSKHMHNKATGK